MTDNNDDNTEELMAPLIEAKAVEEAMLAKIEERAKTVDPAEVAAQLFTLYFPRFCNQVDRLSSNALRRVLKAIVEVPLNDTPYNHSTDLEKETWAIGDRLMQAKWMLLQTSFYEDGNAEALDKAINEPATTEVEATNEGEERNG